MSEFRDPQMIRALIEGTNDLIHSVKPDGSFEFVNRVWLDTLEYTEDEVKDLFLKDIVHADSLTHYEATLSSIMTGEKSVNLEATFLSKSGKKIFVEGNLFPRIEEARVVSAQGFYRDITESKTAELQLKLERERIEFFLDLMTHDLTNINQEIISVFELLLHYPELPTDLKAFIEEGLVEVDRAANMISNMKKLSLVERKATKTMVRDLAEAVSEAAIQVDVEFTDKNLKLELDAKPGQYNLVADEFLDDVFSALLHNAMKFDDNKDVRVEIRTEAIRHTPFLKVEIMDFGRGIPDENKEEVFTRLTHRRDGITGLGLGLTLVRGILDNYGGTIRVEDRIEGDYRKGANFVMILRLDKTDDTKEENE